MTALPGAVGREQPLGLVIVRVLAAVLSAATALLIAGSLSKKSYGSFALVTGLADFLVIASDLGLTSSLARFSAEQRVDRGLLERVILMRGGLATLAALGLALYGVIAAPTLGVIAAGLLVARSLVAGVNGLLPALGQLRLLWVLSVLLPALELTGVAIVVAAGLGAPAVLTALVAAAGIAATVGITGLLERAPVTREPARLRSVVRYGGALFVVSLCFAAFGVIDHVVITAFHGAAALAPYALAWKLVAMLHIPALAIAVVVAPLLAARGAAAGAVFSHWIGLLGVSYIGISAIAAALAPEIFAVIGSRYRGDAGVFSALAGYGMFAGLAPLASIGANYLGGARTRIRIAASLIATNAVLDLVLVPGLGGYGAAISTTIAFGGYTIAHVILVYRRIGIAPPLRTALGHVPQLVLGAGAAVLVARLGADAVDLPPIAALAVFGALASVTYLAATGRTLRRLWGGLST